MGRPIECDVQGYLGEPSSVEVGRRSANVYTSCVRVNGLTGQVSCLKGERESCSSLQ